MLTRGQGDQGKGQVCSTSVPTQTHLGSKQTWPRSSSTLFYSCWDRNHSSGHMDMHRGLDTDKARVTWKQHKKPGGRDMTMVLQSRIPGGTVGTRSQVGYFSNIFRNTHIWLKLRGGKNPEVTVRLWLLLKFISLLAVMKEKKSCWVNFHSCLSAFMIIF